jgi:hypothetical protein
MLMTACGKTTEPEIMPEVETTDEELTAETLEPVQEVADPFVFPLTGLSSPQDADLNVRPLVVMVENSPAARPQTGLDQADIVYEVLAEGDITRFIAVYQSQTVAEIGPVRSIRPYFVELGVGLDGILIHAGWSQEAMNVMVAKKANHLDQVYGDDAYFYRERTRKMPHNVYTSLERLRLGAQERKFREEWNNPKLEFATKEQVATVMQSIETAATQVTIPYIQNYVVAYTYDSTTNTYLRLMKDKPHLDKMTEQQLSATNVVIIETKHRIVDDVGRREVDVFGPGQGLLLQGGKVRDIMWEFRQGAIRAFDIADAQQEIPLFPGKTWVQIIPTLDKVTYE